MVDCFYWDPFIRSTNPFSTQTILSFSPFYRILYGRYLIVHVMYLFVHILPSEVMKNKLTQPSPPRPEKLWAVLCVE